MKEMFFESIEHYEAWLKEKEEVRPVFRKPENPLKEKKAYELQGEISSLVRQIHEAIADGQYYEKSGYIEEKPYITRLKQRRRGLSDEYERLTGEKF